MFRNPETYRRNSKALIAPNRRIVRSARRHQISARQTRRVLGIPTIRLLARPVLSWCLFSRDCPVAASVRYGRFAPGFRFLRFRPSRRRSISFSV